MNPIRWSNLKYMAEAPAVYKHILEHGVAVSPVMRFGSLVHALVLGVAPNSFVVFEGQRRGNAWKDFKEAHQDVEIVTSDEWTRASAAADAVKADPVCGPLIRQGEREQRIHWEIGGRPCAGTPDLNGGVLIDLKTTAMNPGRLPWHARKMQWHAQLAWYKHGLEARGEKVSSVLLITITPKAPHLCTVYELTENALDIGLRQWRLLFERLLVCEASDEWPGYAQSVLPLDIEDTEDLTLTIDGIEVDL